MTGFQIAISNSCHDEMPKGQRLGDHFPKAIVFWDRLKLIDLISETSGGNSLKMRIDRLEGSLDMIQEELKFLRSIFLEQRQQQ